MYSGSHHKRICGQLKLCSILVRAMGNAGTFLRAILGALAALSLFCSQNACALTLDHASQHAGHHGTQNNTHDHHAAGQHNHDHKQNEPAGSCCTEHHPSLLTSSFSFTHLKSLAPLSPLEASIFAQASTPIDALYVPSITPSPPRLIIRSQLTDSLSILPNAPPCSIGA